MNKTLRFSLLSMLTMLCSALFAQTTVTFDAAVDKGTDDGKNAAATSVTKEGVSLAISTGIMGNGKEYRCYKGQTLTVTSTVGNISNIEVTCTAQGDSKYGPGNYKTTVGNYTFESNSNNGAWTGDAAEVVLTAETNQVRMTKVVVTYQGEASGKKDAGLSYSETSISVEKGKTFTAPTFTKATTANVTFTSDNEKVATVNSEGVISLAGGTGEAVVTATSEENADYKAGKAVCTVNVFTYNIYGKTTSITSGKQYLIVAQRNDSTAYASPLDESKNYGYLSTFIIEKPTDSISIKSLYNDAFLITETNGGYYIQDAYGRYLYQEQSFNSFQLSKDAPETPWTIDPQTDGTFKISMNDYYIQWGDGKYTSFGVYNTKKERTMLPMLYQLNETATGIEQIKNANTSKPTDNAIYNLAGQRLQKLQKGINIVGGKKIIKK